MESKISVSSLAASLVKTTGKSKKMCEDFIREFFKLASEKLETGESVKIKGFGTFKVIDVESRMSVNVSNGERQEIAPHKKVVFTPSKELSSEINAPFAMFDSVEIEDEVPEEIFYDDNEVEVSEEEEEVFMTQPVMPVIPPPIIPEEDKKVDVSQSFAATQQSEDRISDENFVSKEMFVENSVEERSDDIITSEAYESHPEPVSVAETAPVPPPISKPVPEVKTEKEVDTRPIFRLYEEPRKSRFGIGFLTGSLVTLVVCVVIFMLGCFFDWWPEKFGIPKRQKVEVVQDEEPEGIEEEILWDEEPSSEPVQSQTPSSTQSETQTSSQPKAAAQVKAAAKTQTTASSQTKAKTQNQPEAYPTVYDTVTSTRYLTTIARDHYGNFNFWPYIYLENESILGHPDRITPGTKIVVPPLSKYGINPDNKDDVVKAKKKALEIYAKYK